MRKSLILLDVDGVVNDLNGTGKPHRAFVSHGYQILIPESIIPGIQDIVARHNVYWCTTWRERANDEIRRALGIPELPVVTDGTEDRYVGWKWPSAYPLAKQVLDEGRSVFWIEDFYGRTRSPSGLEDVYEHFQPT